MTLEMPDFTGFAMRTFLRGSIHLFPPIRVCFDIMTYKGKRVETIGLLGYRIRG